MILVVAVLGVFVGIGLDEFSLTSTAAATRRVGIVIIQERFRLFPWIAGLLGLRYLQFLADVVRSTKSLDAVTPFGGWESYLWVAAALLFCSWAFTLWGDAVWWGAAVGDGSIPRGIYTLSVLAATLTVTGASLFGRRDVVSDSWLWHRLTLLHFATALGVTAVGTGPVSGNGSVLAVTAPVCICAVLVASITMQPMENGGTDVNRS